MTVNIAAPGIYSGATYPNRMSELRVFTDHVPSPGALGLCALAGLVARRRRR